MWRSGDQILVRYVHRARVFWASPLSVIEHGPERLVTYLAPGSRVMRPSNRIPTAWELVERPWTDDGALQITRFGEPWALWLWWDRGTFVNWYVNLQEPLRPAHDGFDTMDHLLDLWREPGGAWQWKDEDELDQAVRLGAFTEAERTAIRAAGERAIRDVVVPTGWEDWRPDPSWPIPALPDGWDRLS